MPKNYQLLISGFALAKLALHFAANANYGLHADELYYIALSKHLQWGYLDNSPLIGFITAFSRLCFGESAFAYRVFPTLFSAATVYLTGLATYNLGGKKLAITLTGAAMLCSPAYLATSYFLQPVAFEQFYWTAMGFCLLRYIQTGKQSFIYSCAILLGLGILNKYTILIYAFAIGIGILITKSRQKIQLSNLLMPAFICLLFVLPNILWQIQHHFPVLRYVSIVKSHQGYKGISDYLFQFFFMHGSAVAVWLAGLGYLLFSKQHIDYRFIAWAFVFTAITLFTLQGKIYYGLGAFPLLFSAGGVCWEEMLKRSAAFFRYCFFAVLALPALIALPAVIPILPFNGMLYYFKLMRTYTHITQPLMWEDGQAHPIPQFYADMLGWRELAQLANKAGSLLTAEQRKHAVILTEQYPVTGAVSYYSSDQLPIISPNNSFIIWSPKELKADYVIYFSRKGKGEISALANGITDAGTLQRPLAREHGIHVYVLYQTSAILKEKYLQQRNKFLP